MTRHIDLLRQHEKETTKKPRRKKKAAPAENEMQPAETIDQALAALPDENNGLIDEPSPIADEPFAALPDEAPAMDEAVKPAPGERAIADSPNDIKHLLLHTIEMTLEAFRHAAADKPFSFVALEKEVGNIAAWLERDRDMLNHFELLLVNREMHLRKMDAELGDLLQKAMIMMLYSLKVGLQLELPHLSLSELALAATLHHLGMSRIATDIRHKQGKLTSEELEAIRKAPAFSVAYLEKNGLQRPDILQAVENAQERYDGSGPKGLEGGQIPFMARVVGLLSMFESLVHIRSYRERLLPRDAIRMLIKNHKKTFDPSILRALIDAISLYPVGCYVQLNTGEVGQVVYVNPRLPLRPKVEIRFNRHGNEIPARDVDLRNQPTLMIRRCMYEESAKNLSE